MLLHLTLLFWMVLDPVGNVPVFAAQVGFLPIKRQRIVIIREMIIALGIMILALFFGTEFFQLLDIHASAVSITGGIILFLIGLKMVLGELSNGHSEKVPRHEPLIVPLAVPMTAGPGILATIILYGGELGNYPLVLGALVLAWAFSLPIVLLAPQIKRYLGPNGAIAIERLFGFVVVLIAAQTFFHGILNI